MKASIDISYYPLSSDYRTFIIEFIKSVKNSYPELSFDTNGFSTQITGEYDTIMSVFQHEIKDTLQKQKCVFVIKLAAGERTRENLPDELK